MGREQREFDLQEYVGILLRRKWWVILSCFAVLIGSAIYTVTRTPLFETSAQVLYNPYSIIQTGASPVVQQGDVETQLEVLRSDRLLAKALELMKNPRVSIDQRKVERRRDTSIFIINVRSRRPQDAMNVANALGDAYIQQTLDDARNTSEQGLKYVDEQVRVAGAELDGAETALREWKETQGIVELDPAVSAQVARVEDLETQLKNSRGENATLLTRLREINRQRRGLAATTTKVSNPTVEALKGALVQLETQRLGLLSTLTERDPEVLDLDAKAANLRTRIREEVSRILAGQSGGSPELLALDAQQAAVETDVAVQHAKEAALQARLNLERPRLDTMPGKQVEYSRLQRRYKVAEDSYTQLLGKQQELRIERATQVAKAMIISPATEPRFPVFPNPRNNLITALIVGLLVGIALAVLVDYLDDTLRDAADAERTLEMPALGVIPVWYDEDPVLSGSFDEFSSYVEAFRTLRAGIRLTASGERLHTILVTSPSEGEGSSTVAADLALTAAYAGSKVIIIDADLRRPQLHEFFKLPLEVGLTNVVTGTASLDEALLSASQKGLQVIPCGPLPQNAVELLESDAMPQLLETLSQRADLVIVDAPPVLAVADARILASLVDATLLVVEVNGTRRSEARMAKEFLRRSNARVVGMVANRVRTGAAAYHYVQGE